MLPENTTPKLALAGAAEAAEMLGTDRPQISRWQKGGKMPEVYAQLRCGPIWLAEDIEKMVIERARDRVAARASRGA